MVTKNSPRRDVAQGSERCPDAQTSDSQACQLVDHHENEFLANYRIILELPATPPYIRQNQAVH